MFDLEVVINILYLIATIGAPFYIFRLKRKHSVICFGAAYYMGEAFSFLIYLSILMGNLQLLSEVVSSLVIGWLTLALVWAELDKRPELALLGFVPIIHDERTTNLYKADYFGNLTDPSRLLKIREASYPQLEDLRFDRQCSFAVDLANIGYEEIVAHEYVVYVDGVRGRPVALLTLPPDQRLTLKTQQRYTINMEALGMEKAGFHKVRIEVSATTAKISKEVWFFISDDFKKLRYVHVYPLERLLSHFIKSELADP